jgi:protein TonB
MPEPLQPLRRLQATGPPPRRPYRPPVGIPVPRQDRVGSFFASLLFHVLLLLFVLGPIFVHDVLQAAEGAGGRGPTGGGGGGRNASGGTVKQRVQFIQVKPPPPPPPNPLPTPVVVPPPVKPPEPETPRPEPPKAQPDAPKDSAATPGTGGGTGRDGTSGAGPGTGGGIGSGDGTGRGTNRGPGTGGGEGRIYPPFVTNLAILPMPAPAKVKPYKLTACFEVDEKGNAKLISWNPSKDGDYNRKIKAMLDEVRFKPAVRWDGVPVKVTSCDFTAEALR